MIAEEDGAAVVEDEMAGSVVTLPFALLLAPFDALIEMASTSASPNTTYSFTTVPDDMFNTVSFETLYGLDDI